MYPYFCASEDLLETFVDYDLRLNRYIVRSPKGSTSEQLYMAYGKVNTGYTTLKNGTVETDYYMPKAATGEFGRSLRLSEAYLNYAEALAMQGDINGATDALNTLREKRFDPEDYEDETFDSQEELIEFVRDERRRELCFEGHRWFDLRRWGMPAITHTWHDNESQSSNYTLQEDDLLYTIPIPDEALQSNASLVQNELPGKRIAQ